MKEGFKALFGGGTFRKKKEGPPHTFSIFRGGVSPKYRGFLEKGFVTRFFLAPKEAPPRGAPPPHTPPGGGGGGGVFFFPPNTPLLNISGVWGEESPLLFIRKKLETLGGREGPPRVRVAGMILGSSRRDTLGDYSTTPTLLKSSITTPSPSPHPIPL